MYIYREREEGHATMVVGNVVGYQIWRGQKPPQLQAATSLSPAACLAARGPVDCCQEAELVEAAPIPQSPTIRPKQSVIGTANGPS